MGFYAAVDIVVVGSWPYDVHAKSSPFSFMDKIWKQRKIDIYYSVYLSVCMSLYVIRLSVYLGQ